MCLKWNLHCWLINSELVVKPMYKWLKHMVVLTDSRGWLHWLHKEVWLYGNQWKAKKKHHDVFMVSISNFRFISIRKMVQYEPQWCIWLGKMYCTGHVRPNYHSLSKLCCMVTLRCKMCVWSLLGRCPQFRSFLYHYVTPAAERIFCTSVKLAPL